MPRLLTKDRIQLAYESAHEAYRTLGRINMDSPKIADVEMAVAETESTLRTLRMLRKRMLEGGK